MMKWVWGDDVPFLRRTENGNLVHDRPSAKVVFFHVLVVWANGFMIDGC